MSAGHRRPHFPADVVALLVVGGAFLAAGLTGAGMIAVVIGAVVLTGGVALSLRPVPDAEAREAARMKGVRIDPRAYLYFLRKNNR